MSTLPPQGSARNASQPIFILSNFRTGSTLLRYALDAHPDICCPGELRLATLCQQVFNVVELTSTSDDHDDDAAAHVGRLARVREIVDGIMDKYCRTKGKTRWCEKSPFNTEALYVIESVFPDAAFICLHRNVSDQVQSTLEYEGPSRLQRYLARRNGDQTAAAVDRWCTVAERLLAFEHAHRSHTVRLLYEKFVFNPEAELRRVLTTIGAADVSGLSSAAFKVKHDRGPQDAKIFQTAEVKTDRVGKGVPLSIEALPPDLASRSANLLRRLGYDF